MQDLSLARCSDQRKEVLRKVKRTGVVHCFTALQTTSTDFDRISAELIGGLTAKLQWGGAFGVICPTKYVSRCCLLLKEVEAYLGRNVVGAAQNL